MTHRKSDWSAAKAASGSMSDDEMK